MSDSSSPAIGQMVDEIIAAVENARKNECPHQVRKGIIDSLYWINAYQLIQRYKDELKKFGYWPAYIDDGGYDWVTEIITLETILKRLQREAIKVANMGKYGVSIATQDEATAGNNAYSTSTSPWVNTKAQIGSGNVANPGSANTITLNVGVGSHRLNDNGVLEVKTENGWVPVDYVSDDEDLN